MLWLLNPRFLAQCMIEQPLLSNGVVVGKNITERGKSVVLLTMTTHHRSPLRPRMVRCFCDVLPDARHRLLSKPWD